MFNLNLEPFHEIPKHSGSAEALKYARDWLTTCQNNIRTVAQSRKIMETGLHYLKHLYAYFEYATRN